MSEGDFLYTLSVADVVAQVGRPITDDEAHDLEKALEFALGDVVPDVIAQVFGAADDDD